MFGNDISKILENAQSSRKFYCILDGDEYVENEIGVMCTQRFFKAIESSESQSFVDFFNKVTENALFDLRNDIIERVHIAFLNSDFTMIYGDTLK